MIFFEAVGQRRFIEGLAAVNPLPPATTFFSDKSKKYTITEQLLQNHVENIVIFREGRGGWDFALLFFCPLRIQLTEATFPRGGVEPVDRALHHQRHVVSLSLREDVKK